jgi:hypothetical protein
VGTAQDVYVRSSESTEEVTVKRLFAFGAGVAALAGIAIPTLADAHRQASTQRVQSGGWVVCREQLVIHSHPALTPNPRPAKFTSSDVLDNCSSSDPTIDRGIAIVKNSGPHASCGPMGGGQFAGIGRIRWNNGKVTRIRDFVSFGGTIALGRGKIIGGTEFVGAPFKAVDKALLDPSVLELCGSPMGLGMFFADGEIAIGHTSIDGVPFAP